MRALRGSCHTSAMPPRFALLRTPDRVAAESWLAAKTPDEVLAWPGLWLAAWNDSGTALMHTADGRAAGTLVGALANDRATARVLDTRGLTIALHDHRGLAVDTVALSGPEGLGRLRWQGSLAVAHLAQRMVLVARDPMGVGGLVIGRWADGEIVASDPGLLDGRCSPVPGGLVGLATVKGIAWQEARLHAEARPWLRDVPDELRRADAAQIEAGLLVRIGEAAQSLARGLGGLTGENPTDAAGRWLVERMPAARGEDAEASSAYEETASWHGHWTLTGVDSLLGVLPAPPPDWQRAIADVVLPQPEPPEPIAGVPEPDRQQRIWRATWLADHLLSRDRIAALARGQTLVAPHLDVAVLAWLGATPASLRPKLRQV